MLYSVSSFQLFIDKFFEVYRAMNAMKRLTREFFERGTQTVAKELLGKYLVRTGGVEPMIGKVIEVEAYLGATDKACHAYSYKKTERSKIMYQKGGSLYIYYIYGINFCLNVVTEPEGVPGAVFLRKLSPISGIDLMIKNRGAKIGRNYRNLLDGPGKLCKAMNITKDEFNGKDSCESTSNLFFTQGVQIDEKTIALNKRIGIDYAQEDKDRLLRFILTTS